YPDIDQQVYQPSGPNAGDAEEVADLRGYKLLDRRVVENDAVIVSLIVSLEEAELRSGVGLALEGVDLVRHHCLPKRMAAADVLGTCDFQPLPLFHDVDELRGFKQRIMGGGVEPRVAAPEALDVKLAALEVPLVEIGDFELAARRRLHFAYDVDHARVVEIQV